MHVPLLCLTTLKKPRRLLTQSKTLERLIAVPGRSEGVSEKTTASWPAATSGTIYLLKRLHNHFLQVLERSERAFAAGDYGMVPHWLVE